MKKQNRRRKLGKRNSSKELQSRHRRPSLLESLEARDLLAADLIFGPGTNEPRQEVKAEIRINEAERSIDPIDERILNNSLATAERVPLGFDFGEYAAIDFRGEIIEPSAENFELNKECNDSGCPARVDLLGNQIPPEEDGAFRFAETVPWEGGVQTTYLGAIGDKQGALALRDADFYEFLEVDAGRTITARLDSANNGLTLYDEFGFVLQTSDAISPFQTGDAFISFTVPEDGDYYIAVSPFEAAFTDAWFPPDPYIVGDVFPQQGAQGENVYNLTVGVNGLDVDYLAIDMEPGDILGVNGIGSVSVMSVFTPDQSLMYTVGQGQLLLPLDSPLPAGGNATAAYVADTAGTHYLKVESFFDSRYLLEMRMFRPPAELELAGERQILFLDFDGSFLNPAVFGNQSQLSYLSPMRSFMGRWGLTSERQLVDAIVDVVDKDLNRDLQKINPDAGVTILNSYDHDDPFGQPNVSRIIVGGTIDQSTISTIGIANSIDVGNFDQEETAIVLLDLLSANRFDPNSLNTFELAPGARKVDLVASGVGGVISHEAGHFYGAYHTDRNNNVPSLMDSGGEMWKLAGVGDDRVWGTSDDPDVAFVTDEFAQTEGYFGVENVGGMLANILVSGKARTAPGGGTEPVPTTTGFVFNDVDASGLQEPGEIGLPNIRVYIDVNNDGEFGIAEPTAITDSNGNYELPAGQGDGVIRLLLGAGQVLTVSSDDGSFAGVQSLTGDQSGTDLGDAPASYGITSNDIQAGIRLGSAVDNDAESGSDSEDDGVSFGSLSAGSTGTVTITATTNGYAPGLVNGWIDFNSNGQFESFEKVVNNGRLEGTETYSFPVPVNAAEGQTWARFRLGYLRDAAATGDGGVGEVEDYMVNVEGINVVDPGDPVDPVDPGTGEVAPVANNDTFNLAAGATSSSLNVLLNDSPGSAAVSIQEVSTSTVGSTVTISDDGLRLNYSPADGFSGSETLMYTITSTAGTSTASVTVNVEGSPVTAGDLVGFRVETVDLAGLPISTVGVGSLFNVNVYVDDLRPDNEAEGVFAAYLDVNFDDALAAVEGTATFAPYFSFFQNPRDGDFSTLTPEDNDLGGSTRESSGIADERLLMTIPMVANSAGVLEITTDGPDNLPGREILLWPASAEDVTSDRIDFGSTSLTITNVTAASSPYMNPVNRYDVNNDGFVSPKDVKILIDNINDFGARELSSTIAPVSGNYLDVSGDDNLSPKDVLFVVTALNNANSTAAGEPASLSGVAVDSLFDADAGDDNDFCCCGACTASRALNLR